MWLWTDRHISGSLGLTSGTKSWLYRGEQQLSWPTKGKCFFFFWPENKPVKKWVNDKGFRMDCHLQRILQHRLPNQSEVDILYLCSLILSSLGHRESFESVRQMHRNAGVSLKEDVGKTRVRYPPELVTCWPHSSPSFLYADQISAPSFASAHPFTLSDWLSASSRCYLSGLPLDAGEQLEHQVLLDTSSSRVGTRCKSLLINSHWIAYPRLQTITFLLVVRTTRLEPPPIWSIFIWNTTKYYGSSSPWKLSRFL